jgi:D-inositol-3-phosphate glycosyltransferase
MNVYVREVASHMARLGAHVTVFTRARSPRELGTRVLEPGLEVVGVECCGFGEASRLELYQNLSVFEKAVIDVVSSEGAPDFLYAHYWLSGLVAHRLKHLLSVPYGMSFHTLATLKKAAGYPVEPSFREQCEAEIVGCADVVFCSSLAEVGAVSSLAEGAQAKTLIVRPGVNSAVFAPGSKALARSAVGFGQAESILLYAGRIEPLKRVDALISAALSLGERGIKARAVVVGGPSGPEGEAYLGQLISMAPAGLVEFRAAVAQEELSTYYRACDAVVLPSASETFGMVALEAMACGAPVVARRGSGVAEVVEDGATGMLFADDGDLAPLLARLLTDAGFSQALGQAGAAVARGRTWKDAAVKVLSRASDVIAASPVCARACPM